MQLNGEKQKNKKYIEEINKQRNIINQLTTQLNSEKQNNLILNNQLKNYININSQLNKSLNLRNAEIQNLNSIIKSSGSLSTVKSLNPGEKVIGIHFSSIDQKINYPVSCKNTDIFVKIEQLLYRDYPHLKEENTYFTVSGNFVKRFKTMAENNIKNHDTILLNIYQ